MEAALHAYLLANDNPPDHAAAWRWLADQVESYPDGLEVPAMRQTTKAAFPSSYAVVKCYHEREANAGGSPFRSIRVLDNQTETLVPMAHAGNPAELMSRILFTRDRRGTLFMVHRGQDVEFDNLLDQCLEWWLHNGYTLNPLGSLSGLRAIQVRRGRDTWWLCDPGIATGVEFRRDLSGNAVLDTLNTLRSMLWSTFHVSLRPTVAGAAVLAMRRFLPSDYWLWRPSPLHKAMCRAGGGYRGGFVYAQHSRGAMWKLDINRLYTWCLTQPLPLRVSVARWQPGEDYRHGIWMCTLRGSGMLPVRCAYWSERSGRIVHGYHSAGRRVAILSGAEIGGIISLGYDVAPRWGYRYNRTFTLAAYAGQLDRILATGGRGSPTGQMAKHLGNTVYGKFAQSEAATTLRFALDKPGPEWQPHCGSNGNETPYLWSRPVTAYRSHQQLPIAATITAHGRGSLYRALAQLTRAGYHVFAADTDGVLASGYETAGLDLDELALGRWRVVGFDNDAIVAHNKCYVFGGAPIYAGSSGATRDSVNAAFHAEKPSPATADDGFVETVRRLAVR